MFKKPSTIAWAAGSLLTLGAVAYTLITKKKKNNNNNNNNDIIKGNKKKSLSSSSLSSKNSKRNPKFIKTFRSKPFDIHLVMSNESIYYAFVAADKKNEIQRLKFGARLIKIDGVRVKKWSYEDIYRKLMSIKIPVTLEFREQPELEKQWIEAEKLKEEGNEYYKKGNIKSGIEYLSKAIALHPTNKVYYSNRVLMYLKNKEYDKALEDCQRIRELDPVSRYIKGHYLRGLVLYNMKEYKKAANAFRTVIKINPNFKEAIKRLDECKVYIDEEEGEEEEAEAEEETQSKRNSETSPTSIINAVTNSKDNTSNDYAHNNNNNNNNNFKIKENEKNDDDIHILNENENDIENNEPDMTEIGVTNEEPVENSKTEKKIISSKVTQDVQNQDNLTTNQ